MDRGGPVVDLHRRGHRHREGQAREHQRGQIALAVDEHVVTPDEEGHGGQSDRRVGDEAVAEQLLLREGRDDLGDHPHAGQDHDVHGRVGVEPEQVLEQHRVAAIGRVEHADMEGAFRDQQDQRRGDDRRREQEDQARGVVRPDEDRQLEPRHAGRRMVWIVTTKLSPVRIDEKPTMVTPISAGSTQVLEKAVESGA